MQFGDIVFDDEVDDYFYFVINFKIGYFWLVIGGNESFKIGLDEVGQVIVQYCLFIEKIGFGFFMEVCFNVVGV